MLQNSDRESRLTLPEPLQRDRMDFISEGVATVQ